MKAFYEQNTQTFTARCNSNLNFPLHLHSQMEIIYVLENKITIKLDNSELLLEKGDFAIIFPNIIHGYDSSVIEGSNSVTNVIFDHSLTGSFINRVSKYHPINPVIYSKDVHPDIPYALNSLTEEFAKNGDIKIVEAFIQLILARVLPSFEFEKNTSLKDDSLTYKIALYISENYKNAISLDTLASELCVCKYHVSRIFSKNFGIGFNDYLNNTRLKMATYLLDTTDKPIIDIWNECGFESQRTFNRAFKLEFNLSPSEYRNPK